jgi:two-component system sensor kinase FixL
LPDGSLRWVMGKGEVLCDEFRRPARMLGVNVDITESKRAEEALRRSEERFAKAFRSSPMAMIISRKADGRIIEVNEKWETVFGFGREAAVGRTVLGLKIYCDDHDREKLLSLAEANEGVRDMELVLCTRTGELRQTVVATEVVQMGEEPCFITIIRDITEQRQAELEAREQRQQLAHLTRVAILGELSGALAHELNQPLTAILCNAQAADRLLGKEPPDLAEVREIIRDIIAEDKRAGEVVNRLRAWFRKGDGQYQALDINEVTREVLSLARSELVIHDVGVITRLASRLPLVHGDRVQLQQVLLNLVINASEAMSANRREDRKLTVVTTRQGESRVQLSLSDHGTGISADKLDRVFDPFFTTKPNGLGLGLSICRSMVAAHGGQLWAENNPNGGATFHLALPVRVGQNS